MAAVHGMNPEIICFLEDHKVEFPVKEKREEEEEQSSTFNLKCFQKSIKCYHNDIAKYILNLMSIDDDQSEINKIISEYGFEYYNYEFWSSDLDNYSFLDLALQHDNLTILQIL